MSLALVAYRVYVTVVTPERILVFCTCFPVTVFVFVFILCCSNVAFLYCPNFLLLADSNCFCNLSLIVHLLLLWEATRGTTDDGHCPMDELYCCI